jgi:hypothetical protein
LHPDVLEAATERARTADEHPFGFYEQRGNWQQALDPDTSGAQASLGGGVDDTTEPRERPARSGAEHELPLLRPLDGSQRTGHDTGSLPRRFANRLGGKQVVWDDGGGLRIRDDGDESIAAGDILAGVEGKRLELQS